MKKHEPLTEGQLLAIKARAEAATPGPWVVDLPDWGEFNGISSKNGTQILNAGSCIPDPQTAVDYGGTVHDWKEEIYDYGVHKWDDADFIAHAREDIPALLAEVERLRTREDWLIKQLSMGGEWICPMPDDYKCDWRTIDSCHAPSSSTREQCWRMAADMATREKSG